MTATGILRPADKVSVIRNIYAGKIEEINYLEGQKSKKGDILYIINSDKLKLDQRQLHKREKEVTHDIAMLRLLDESISSDNSIAENDLEYYNRYLSFKYQYEQLYFEYKRAENRYLREKKMASYATTENNLKELKTNYMIAKLNMERYKTETLVTIKKELEDKKKTN